MSVVKIKIGIDLDAVLVDIITPLLTYINRRHNKCVIQTELTGYEFNVYFGVDNDTITNDVRDFYKSDCFNTLSPISGAVDGVTKLKKHNQLYIVTARPKYLENKTTDWVTKHFGDAFKEIYFTGQALGNKKVTKGEICKDVGIDVLIDDHLDHCIDCVKYGVRAIVLDYSWNRTPIKYDIVRAKNWNDIVEIIERM